VAETKYRILTQYRPPTRLRWTYHSQKKLALYSTFYNWTRIHKTLRVTPAMAADLTDRLWTMERIVAPMDEVAPKPGRPKTYKKWKEMR
jgi:hypothetical protein